MHDNNNVVWHTPQVTRQMRETLNGHRSFVLWFTGLPSSGKSTIAHAVEKKLHNMRIKTYTLDGDNVRHGLCSDLGFSPKDREENLRRIGEMIKLFLDAGVVVLAAFVSPFRKDRERVRNMLSKRDFVEIYCKCPVDVCEMRDPKGMYKKAKQGEIKDYTGVSAPYEEPESPNLILDTNNVSITENLKKVLQFIEREALLVKRESSIKAPI